jgi:hypothetical protein
MKKKISKTKADRQIDSPLIFILILALLIVSFGLIFIGLLNFKRKDGAVFKSKERVQNVILEDERSVSEYFEDVDFSEEEDRFLKEDPFKDRCADVSGDGVPSVSSGTVCLR